MNASQIATYDTFKRRLLGAKSLDLHDGLLVHTLASSAAGTVATTACSPFDVLKSRVRSRVHGVRRRRHKSAQIMNAKGNESMLQAARTSFKQDGVFWLFRGATWPRYALSQTHWQQGGLRLG
jgi:dicarboxylate transporter 10